MSQLVIAGDTSGTVTLQAPSVAGATVLTLPTTSGTLAVGSSAMTLVSTQSVSNVASMTFTGLSGYNKYLLIVTNFLPVSGTSTFGLCLQYGTGSSPTYVTSNYASGGIDGSTGFNSTGQTSIILTAQANYVNPSGGSNTFGTSASIVIENFNTSQPILQSTGGYTVNPANGLTPYQTVAYGYNTALGATPTAIKLFFYTSGVNIYSGSASLYGISS